MGRAVNSIKAVLRKHCPSAVSNRSINQSALEFATRMGHVLRTYREYQVGILEDRLTDDRLRRQCIQEASKIEAMLTSAGVPNDKAGRCLAELSQLQQTNSIIALLQAGETFRRLMAGNSQNLLSALGQTSGAILVLDTSVLIPLLCGRLHGDIKDPAVTGATQLSTVPESSASPSTHLPCILKRLLPI